MNLEILLWNMNGDAECKAPERYKAANKIIAILKNKKNDNIFVLAQEIKTQIMHHWVNEIVEEKHKRGYKEEANIYYTGDPEQYKIRIIDVGKATSVNDQIKYEEENPEIVRIQAAVVNDQLLVVSWHGVNESSKISDLSRENRFNKMMTFVQKLREKEHCKFVIVGGDFNFEQSQAAKSDSIKTMSAEVICGYEQPTDRTHAYDYLVTWPSGNVKLNKVEWMKTVRDKDKRPFDHPLVRYSLTIKYDHDPQEAGAQATVPDETSAGRLRLTCSRESPVFHTEVKPKKVEKSSGPTQLTEDVKPKKVDKSHRSKQLTEDVKPKKVDKSQGPKQLTDDVKPKQVDKSHGSKKLTEDVTKIPKQVDKSCGAKKLTEDVKPKQVDKSHRSKQLTEGVKSHGSEVKPKKETKRQGTGQETQ